MTIPEMYGTMIFLHANSPKYLDTSAHGFLGSTSNFLSFSKITLFLPM